MALVEEKLRQHRMTWLVTFNIGLSQLEDESCSKRRLLGNVVVGKNWHVGCNVERWQSGIYS